MKYFILSLFVAASLGFGARAEESKESVAFVTHRIVIKKDGTVGSVAPVETRVFAPEGSKLSTKEHQDNISKAETLFNFKEALGKLADKTVEVISTEKFQTVAKGAVSAAVVAGGAALAYGALKKDEAKESKN